MNCGEVQNKLIFFIEGDLHSNYSILIKEHIEKCRDCKYLLDQLKASLEFIEKDKQTETNPFFVTRVMASVNSEPKQIPLINWLRKKQYSIQVSLYSLLIVAAIALGHYLGKDKVTVEMEAVLQEKEISDNQLVAESYQFQINDEDVYIIKADENGE